MKIKILICCAVFSTLLFGAALEGKAQSPDSLALIKDDFNLGKKFYKKTLYNFAIQHFLPLAQAYPDNSSFNYCVGMCYYYNSANYDSAIYYLSKATSPITSFYKMNYKTKNAPTEVYYYLGMAYMRNSMPETAVNHFNYYKKYLNPEIKAQKELIEDIDLQIELCMREKEHFKKVRDARTMNRDSIQKVADHFRAQYLNILSVLEQRDHEIEQLYAEMKASNKSQIKPLAQLTSNDGQPLLYTIQIVATRQKVDLKEFKDLIGVRECRLPDGLYHYTKGEFKTRKEAEAVCLELWEMGYVNAWIRPIIQCLPQ